MIEPLWASSAMWWPRWYHQNRSGATRSRAVMNSGPEARSAGRCTSARVPFAAALEAAGACRACGGAGRPIGLRSGGGGALAEPVHHVADAQVGELGQVEVADVELDVDLLLEQGHPLDQHERVQVQRAEP